MRLRQEEALLLLEDTGRRERRNRQRRAHSLALTRDLAMSLTSSKCKWMDLEASKRCVCKLLSSNSGKEFTGFVKQAGLPLRCQHPV